MIPLRVTRRVSFRSKKAAILYCRKTEGKSVLSTAALANPSAQGMRAVSVQVYKQRAQGVMIIKHKTKQT